MILKVLIAWGIGKNMDSWNQALWLRLSRGKALVIYRAVFPGILILQEA